MTLCVHSKPGQGLSALNANFVCVSAFADYGIYALTVAEIGAVPDLTPIRRRGMCDDRTGARFESGRFQRR